MADRTRKRHERKLARKQQATASSQLSLSSTSSTPVPNDRTSKRPVFAPTEDDLRRVDRLTSNPSLDPSHPPQSSSSPPNHQNLNRGKSLRDKVEAALGRFNSAGRKKATRSQSVSVINTSSPKAPYSPHLNDPPMVERKEGLGALARRISKKLTIEDQERRRRERLDMAYAEPPLLSHTLVGAASPFPMRPALSTLVPTAELKYGEAHTDYSPNPFRRRQNLNTSVDPNKLNMASNHYQSSAMRS